MPIRPYLNHQPQLGHNVYVDEAAVIIGKVVLDDEVSVWPGAILRGDVNHIHVGKRSNIQDGSILHVTGGGVAQPHGSPLMIGEDVTIGHRVTLHGCTIGNRVLVGMGAIVLDDAVVEDEVMIGAGSLVPPRKRLASGFLYIGVPAKAVRELNEQEKAFLRQSALNYVTTAIDYLK